MATNYNSKKKADLEVLLKERGLPHTGNKPDLVARLQEDDTKKGSADTAGPAAGTTTAPAGDQDQIDWGEDEANPPASNLEAAQATDDPANKAALEAGGIGRVDNPVSVPNQVVDEANEPGKTTDTVVSLPAATADDTGAEAQTEEDAEAKKKAYEEKFGADLAASEADKEAEKRRKRAERFGKPQSNEEEIKLEERAKKFGASTEDSDKLIKMLDGALPERRERKRGRDRADVGRGGVNKRVDSRRRDNRPRGPPRSGRQGLSDADRAAAERRAARFSKS